MKVDYSLKIYRLKNKIISSNHQLQLTLKTPERFKMYENIFFLFFHFNFAKDKNYYYYLLAMPREFEKKIYFFKKP